MRNFSTETAVFVEKLRIMQDFSIGTAILVEFQAEFV